MVPGQDDLLRVDPTTSFAPTLYSNRQLRCRLQVKGYDAVPVDDTVVDTPGELGPKGYFDRRTVVSTTDIAVPVGAVSLITVHFRRFSRGSFADVRRWDECDIRSAIGFACSTLQFTTV